MAVMAAHRCHRHYRRRHCQRYRARRRWFVRRAPTLPPDSKAPRTTLCFVRRPRVCVCVCVRGGWYGVLRGRAGADQERLADALLHAAGARVHRGRGQHPAGGERHARGDAGRGEEPRRNGLQTMLMERKEGDKERRRGASSKWKR